MRGQQVDGPVAGSFGSQAKEIEVGHCVEWPVILNESEAEHHG